MRRLSLGLVATTAIFAAYSVLAPRGAAEPAAVPDTAVAPAAAGATAAPRPPAPVARGPEVEALRGEIERLIRNTGWRTDEWGVLVVSLDHGDTVFAHEAGRALAPASNMKLFTSAAALHYLGPDFRYSTYLMTDGTLKGGVLEGDVVVYGTGDPTISNRLLGSKTAVWEAFADTLKAMGITEIRGAVIGDGSYFVGPRVGEGWRETYITASYAAPAGALSFAENMVTLRITPAEQAGLRPSIQLVPGGDGIAMVNQATTSAGGRTAIRVDKPAYDAPIVVRGQIPRRAGAIWRATPVSDPARYAAAMFREVLESRGITVAEGIRSVDEPSESLVTGRSVFAPAFDRRPPLRVLAVHRSPPLLEILHVLNHKSHNFYAEQILRTVGRVAAGEGSVKGGARAVHHMLTADGAPADSTGLVIHDGSGLSPLNRATPEALVRLLDLMAGSEMFDAFVHTLPEAGDPRGLRRMGGTAAAGRLHAKTGTIDHVSALSGYVRTTGGERLAFAIVSNGVPSTWRAKRIEDAIGIRIAGLARPSRAVEPSPEPLPAAPPAPSRAAERAAEPAPAERPAPARSHTIRRGDTLEAIAKRYGTTVAALRRANPGLDPRRLIPGKKVVLP